MDKYIKDFTTVVRDCSMDNTYKMSWARALVEWSCNNTDKKVVRFDELSVLIFKYYWNQTMFFNLNQGPNPFKKPIIHQVVIDEIAKYQDKNGFKPESFTVARKKINIDYDKISKVLSKDVSWRFLKIGNEVHSTYVLDKGKLELELKNPRLLSDNSEVLFQLINYRWGQQLEKFNFSPKISNKVKASNAEKVRRSSLTKFKKYLDLNNPDRICFISGKEIPKEDVSIDHVIPWSYLYSDNLWNLVYVSKKENSSKSNRLPSKAMIQSLKERNINMLSTLERANLIDRHYEELRLSIDSDRLKECWIGCQ